MDECASPSCTASLPKVPADTSSLEPTYKKAPFRGGFHRVEGGELFCSDVCSFYTDNLSLMGRQVFREKCERHIEYSRQHNSKLGMYPRFFEIITRTRERWSAGGE